MPRRQNNQDTTANGEKILMTHRKLVNGFAAVSLFAIFGLVMLFQNTTMNANIIDPELNVPRYVPQSSERFLANEICKTVPAITTGLKSRDCEMIGRLQCNQAYKMKPNYKGDAYTYPLNCVNQCIRDVQAQCKYASSAFKTEGKGI